VQYARTFNLIETTVSAPDQRDFETLITGLMDAEVGVCDAFLDAATRGQTPAT